MARKILHTISRILFNIMVILFALICLVGYLFDNNADFRDTMTTNIFSSQDDEASMGGSKVLRGSIAEASFPTWYNSTDDVLDGNGAIAAAAEAEGAVLLRNDNSVLPLTKGDSGDKVSVFGTAAYAPMYSLGGAGSVTVNSSGVSASYAGISDSYNGTGSSSNRRQDVASELAKYVTINTSLQSTYQSLLSSTKWNSSAFYDNTNGNVNKLRTEAPSDVNGVSETGFNTAIYVIGRMTTEATDLPPHSTSTGTNYFGTTDDYLAISSDEKSMMSYIQSCSFDKFILVLNQANAPQENLDSLCSSYGIDAVVWMGYPGSDGIAGLAKLLVGESSFSGNLSDMWYNAKANNPSDKNFSQGTDVTLQEDMYLGYRYAETRYEDCVLGTDNAGTYTYTDCVNYPFGYGFTYGDGATYNSGYTMTIDSIEGNTDPDKDYYSSGTVYDETTQTTSKRYAYEKYDSGADSYVLDHENSVKKPEYEQRAKGDIENPTDENELGNYDDLILNVTVTNTSQVAGKKIVQVYLQQPYNTKSNVEQVAVELVGYAKTDVLAAAGDPDGKDSQTLQIKIDANKYFAYYDNTYDNSKDDESNTTTGKYVLDAGTYLLTAASNSHEAINNILKYKADNGVSINTNLMDSKFGAGDKDLVSAVTVSDERAASYKYWTQGNSTIDESLTPTSENSDIVAQYQEKYLEATPSNQFDECDPNNNSGATTSVVYMSRSNWDRSNHTNATTYDISATAAGTSYKNGNCTKYDLTTNSTIASHYPAWDSGTGITYGSGSNPKYQLSDMVGVEYDKDRGATDEDVQKWDDFLSCLSWDDYKTLLGNGRRHTPELSYIGKVTTNDLNASNGISWKFSLSNSDAFAHYVGFSSTYDSGNDDQYPTGYPCEGIIASTFNVEIAYAVGQAIGEDALWSGCSGLYGFGLGMHRNPYHGRAGEYYSEDPYLIGTMGGYESLGCQSKGCYVYNKHFLLDDQEYNRSAYNTWFREQTVREIYLRPFEIAIEISDAMNVMTSFNNIGGIWSGQHYGMMHNVLREEFGMAGFAVSDWYPSDNMNLAWGILAGNDLLDGPYSDWDSTAASTSPAYQDALKMSVTRVLYTVANSNAYNGLGEGAGSIQSFSWDPTWYYVEANVVTAVDIVFAVACVFVVVTTVWTIAASMYSKVRKNPDYTGKPNSSNKPVNSSKSKKDNNKKTKK